MENNNLPTGKESIKTIELEPGQSLRIKIIGEEKANNEIELKAIVLKEICYWIGKNPNGDNSDYLEKILIDMANAVCFFTDLATCEPTDEQGEYLYNIQAIARVHQCLIKFLR